MSKQALSKNKFSLVARYLSSSVVICAVGMLLQDINACIAPTPADSLRASANGRPHHQHTSTAQAPQPDVDFGPYMNYMQRAVRLAWFPPRGQEAKGVVIIFKWHEDGSISDLKVGKSSGSAMDDRAALLAIEDAAPLPPLPKGAADYVDIQLGFNCLVEEIYPQTPFD